MNRRLLLTGSALLLALTAGTPCAARAQESNDNTYANIERFIQILTKVRDDYVEPVATDTLMNAAIKGMLRTLDPYSQYLDKDEADQLQTTTQAFYGGLGLSVGIEDGGLTVVGPIEGTPAWKAGIVGGDRILTIDGASTQGLSLDDSMKKMRGQPGTHAVLTILREGRDKPMTFDLVRENIQIKNVPYAGMLPDGVGYIRLSNFWEGTGQEMDAAFDRLEKYHPHGVIVDLRYNPGGLLSEAVQVAEEFTPRGKKVVYERGREPSSNQDFYSNAEHTHSDYPIVLLVNEWTASASEIVTGALQDLDLGLVVGKTTFGKGLVQTVIPLTRNASGPKLKLTTAKYYTPSGRCIQKGEQLKGGALAGKASKGQAPTYRTEMGRTVRGGGGITPDLELAEVKLPKIMEDLEAKQVFFKYAIKYAAQHKQSTPDYALTPQMRDEFTQLLRDEKVEFNADSLAAARRWVDSAMRRELARRYGGEEEAYRVSLQDDDQVKEAAALLDKAPTLPKLLALASELSKDPSPWDMKSVR